MRPIAYVAARFPAWSETFIQREVQLLTEAGLAISPMSLYRPTAPIPEALPRPTVLSTTEPVGDEAHRSRRSLPLPGVLRRYGSLMKHAELLLALRRELSSRNIGHVHAAFADLPGLLVAAAARQEGLPYSISMHAADALNRKYDDNFLFANAAFITICNERVHRLFVDQCPTWREKTHRIRHGLPLNDWPARPVPWAPHEPLRLLFVGRLVDRKQPRLAVAVQQRLCANGQPASLTFIGDGPAAPRLQGADGVVLRGVQPPQAVREAMHEADLLLVCSRESATDMEGLPNVVLEAMASGLPVVSTVTGSIGELLTTATGWPCEPSVDTFEAVINELVAHPEETRSRLAAARQRVEEAYDARRCIDELVRLFQAAQA